MASISSLVSCRMALSFKTFSQLDVYNTLMSNVGCHTLLPVQRRCIRLISSEVSESIAPHRKKKISSFNIIMEPGEPPILTTFPPIPTLEQPCHEFQRLRLSPSSPAALERIGIYFSYNPKGGTNCKNPTNDTKLNKYYKPFLPIALRREARKKTSNDHY